MSKVSAILAAFSVGDAHTMTEIAKRAGLPISTAPAYCSNSLLKGFCTALPTGDSGSD